MPKDKIDQYVEDNKDLIINTIMELVKIPSTKGEPQPGAPFGEGPNAALDKALEIADSMGFDTTNYNGYVGAVDFSKEETALDILAHLDVVPAPSEKWTVTQPFVPVVKDGKLYGRGSADDKGPAVAALVAMKAVKDLGIPLKKNVRLLLGTDEESGSEDIAYYYKSNSPAPATFTPDANFPVTNVEKGRLNARFTASFAKSDTLPQVVKIDCGVRANVIPDSAYAEIKGLDLSKATDIISSWEKDTALAVISEVNGDTARLTVKGVGGHAAHPEPANNALTGLLGLLSRLPLGNSDSSKKLKALAEIFPHGDWSGNAAGIAMEDEISGPLTVSLNILTLDENGFDGQIDSRTSVCATNENTVNVLRAKAEKANLNMEVLSLAPPHHVPEDSPFIKTLLSAYEKYSGLEGYCMTTGGGTYVHGLENAVAFGAAFPGTDNRMHGADEFAVIDELLIAAKVFAQVIVDMCS